MIVARISKYQTSIEIVRPSEAISKKPLLEYCFIESLTVYHPRGKKRFIYGRAYHWLP